MQEAPSSDSAPADPSAPPANPVTPETGETGAGPRRSARGTRDMVLSLVVLLIPVAVIVAIFRFYGGESVNVVDSSAAFASARAASAFPVVQPAGLASGWRSVSAAYQPDAAGAVLRVGYLTPSGGPVQLIESNRPADTLIPAELGDRTQLAETVTEAGLRWQLLTVRNGEHALVSVEPARILIIVGGADVAELRSLAASLR